MTICKWEAPEDNRQLASKQEAASRMLLRSLPTCYPAPIIGGMPEKPGARPHRSNRSSIDVLIYCRKAQISQLTRISIFDGWVSRASQCLMQHAGPNSMEKGVHASACPRRPPAGGHFPWDPCRLPFCQKISREAAAAKNSRKAACHDALLAVAHQSILRTSCSNKKCSPSDVICQCNRMLTAARSTLSQHHKCDHTQI